jgi:hypothetical protein
MFSRRRLVFFAKTPEIQPVAYHPLGRLPMPNNLTPVAVGSFGPQQQRLHSEVICSSDQLDGTNPPIRFETYLKILTPFCVLVAITDKDLVSRGCRHGEFLSFNSEFFPNVEYGKMRSELNECALGADLRVIDSTFYFS